MTMTAHFSDLPLEVLPLILVQLQHRVSDLAACARTCSSFHRYAIPLLYEKLFLRDHTRLRKVFRTLGAKPELAQHVQILELRVFPFGLPAEQLEKLEADIVTALEHATSLRELYWTRTGSLNNRVLRTIFTSLHSLRTLELTGDSRTWSPELLLSQLSPGIRHFAIIMPDRRVSNALVPIAERLGGELRSLNVLCKDSAHITDDILLRMSKHLPVLSRLSLAGCKAVTGKGVQALLDASRTGICELALEGLAVQPSSFSAFHPHLSHLSLLSITYPRSTIAPSEFYTALGGLIERAPSLREFTHYSSGAARPFGAASAGSDDDDEDDDGEGGAEFASHPTPAHGPSSGGGGGMSGPRLPNSFFKRLVASRGPYLTRFRVHGIGMSMDQVGALCESCTKLEDLVIHIYEDQLPLLSTHLSHLPALRSLHILSSANSEAVMSEEDVRNLAQACGPELRQVGFRNRVWLVDRISVPAPPSPSSRAQAQAQAQAHAPSASASTSSQSTTSHSTSHPDPQPQPQPQPQSQSQLASQPEEAQPSAQPQPQSRPNPEADVTPQQPYKNVRTVVAPSSSSSLPSVPPSSSSSVVVTLRRWDMSTGAFPEALLVVRA